MSPRSGRLKSKHVTRIIFDAVTLQQFDKLLFEGLPPMVLFLIVDVGNRPWY
jgi:hypothetical protein